MFTNEYLIWILVVVNVYLFLSLRKEKKRLRVLTSFIGGIITFVSKTPSMIKESVTKEAYSKDEYLKDIKGYEILMKDIKDSFYRSASYEKIVRFIKSNRNLFGGEKMMMGDDGFNRFFLDFLDRCKKDKFWPKGN